MMVTALAIQLDIFSELAVAVGASARLDLTPGGALLLGVLSGILSVYGCVYSTPLLERKLAIHDTCGVNNFGGLASIAFLALDSNAKFLDGDVSVLRIC
jgi:hypothetical protein